MSRFSVGIFQLAPPPTKNPFLCCQVRPNVKALMAVSSDVKGERLPSVPTSAVESVVVSSNGVSPLNSAVTRSGLRDGNPAPTP